MTSNDPAWSTFWSSGYNVAQVPTSGDMWIGKHVGEDDNRTRADEMLGVIVMEAGSGQIDGILYVAGITDDAIGGTNPDYLDYYFNHNYPTDSFNAPPSFMVATQMAMDGYNGGWAMLSADSSQTDLQVRIDEDQLYDAERGHTSEQVGFFVMQQPTFITEDNDPRSAEELEVLYTFEEGSGTTVRDVSGRNHPVDLTVATGDVVWETDRLATFNNVSIVNNNASKVTNSCKLSNGITIELWLQDGYNSYDYDSGQKSIFSLAKSNGELLAGLSSDGSSFSADLNTGAGLLTGSSLVATGASNYQVPQHVVYTWDTLSQTETLYVDGTVAAVAHGSARWPLGMAARS